MTLACRRCTVMDLDNLIKISKSTFATAFEKDNNAEDFQNYVESAFNREKLLQELSNKYSRFYFVFDEKLLVGYFKINQSKAQTDIRDIKSIELERIYVIEKYQGKSVGTWILKTVLELAKKDNKEYVWLGVWEHNKSAIRFYQKHGFRKFGTHTFFVGTDKQTDWLLRLDL
ncbi:putative N-acetyltransferase in pepI 3'region [Flagellimonas maritima]|uniref:Putative N-acetyltransferase in pepI 3'region n=1 Tax=Flagellimonas maritima TaxID=1383885 RepID=A0A2Z4LSC2_9FLAO|nr:GNAT family N-acetyltransferase [Allomuricauda aurantiaca]AWX44609.1 putative N-acetyltransferase in pepI 3'region [Allomuricauda aurantiaca]